MLGASRREHQHVRYHPLVNSEATEDAEETEPGAMAPTIDRSTFDPRYFTKYFTKNLALACGLVAISTFNYAFDQQGFNSTQAMDSFNKTFGHYDPESETYILDTYYLSLLNSLVYVGFAVGAYIGSVISAHYGRRMTIFCMSLW